MLTLTQVLDQVAQHQSGNEALVFGERRYTYSQLKVRVEELTAGLLSLGLGPGDNVAIMLPNWPETLVSLFAVSRTGALAVPLNPRYRSFDGLQILRDARAAALICPARHGPFDYLPMIEAARSQLPSLRQVITVGPSLDGSVPFAGLVEKGKALRQESREEVRKNETGLNADAAHPAVILYTSGTTGEPKGALIPHKSITNGAARLAEALGLEAKDTTLLVVPVFHAFGLACAMAAISAGGRLVLMDSAMKALPVLETIRTEKVTILHGSPTLFASLLTVAPEFGRAGLSTLRLGLVAGAPSSPALIRDVETKLGMKLLNTYGTTELGAVAMVRETDAGEKRYETVGRPLAGYRIQTIDEEGGKGRTDEVGEVLVNSEFTALGYYERPDLTAEAFVDGWYHTGDLGGLDSAGYLRLYGRRKELAKVGGFNVYPAEVEALLTSHPKVGCAAVVSVPHPRFGETLWAFLQTRPNENTTQGEILRFCRANIAYYKVPQFVRIVDELPCTATGKVSKLELRDRALNESMDGASPRLLLEEGKRNGNKTKPIQEYDS